MQLNVQLPPKMRDKLDKAAEDLGRTRAWIVRAALTQWFQNRGQVAANPEVTK